MKTFLHAAALYGKCMGGTAMVLALSATALPAAIVNSTQSGEWNTATTWDGEAVSNQNDYVIVDGHTVNAPVPTGASTYNHTFSGNSLTVGAEGILQFRSTSSGGNATHNLTVASLILQSGATIRLTQAVGNINRTLFAPVVLADSGTVSIAGDNVSSSYNNNLTFAGTLSGGADINISLGANGQGGVGTRKYVAVSSANNTYTGNWSIVAASGSSGRTVALKAGAANALGTGSVNIGVFAQLENNAEGGIDSIEGVNISASSGKLFLTNAWENENAYLISVLGGQIDLGEGNSRIGALTVGDIVYGPGVYDVTDLTLMGLVITGTGTLTVIPEPSTYALLGALALAGAVAWRRRRS